MKAQVENEENEESEESVELYSTTCLSHAGDYVCMSVCLPACVHVSCFSCATLWWSSRAPRQALPRACTKLLSSPPKKHTDYKL